MPELTSQEKWELQKAEIIKLETERKAKWQLAWDRCPPECEALKHWEFMIMLAKERGIKTNGRYI